MRPLFAFILSCDKQELESRVDEAVSPSVLRFALFIFASRKKRKENVFSSFDEKYLFFSFLVFILFPFQCQIIGEKREKAHLVPFFRNTEFSDLYFLELAHFEQKMSLIYPTQQKGDNFSRSIQHDLRPRFHESGVFMNRNEWLGLAPQFPIFCVIDFYVNSTRCRNGL